LGWKKKGLGKAVSSFFLEISNFSVFFYAASDCSDKFIDWQELYTMALQ